MARKEDLKRNQTAVDSTAEYAQIYEALCKSELTLLEAGKTKHAIPRLLHDLIKQATEYLKNGRTVLVVESESLITTQQAADFLGMSRPTFVQLLQIGKIPYTQSGDGKHRRIRVSDLVEYQRIKAERAAAFDRFIKLGEEITSSPDYVEPSMEEILRVIKEVRRENAERRSAEGNS